MITLGILETDQLYPDLQADYRTYGYMFRRLFESLPQSVSGTLTFRHYQVTELEFPADPHECDGYLITGSKAGVYDDLPWLAPLAEHIQRCFTAGIPQIGICFGHQMLAHSLGGYAAQSERGWGIGVRGSAVVKQPDWSKIQSTQIRLIYSHRDQVERLPDGATLLASDAFCPNAAFYIDERVLAFQGHPEFTPTYLRRLLPRRRDAIGEQRWQTGMATVDISHDGKLAGYWMMEFLNQHQRDNKTFDA